MRIVDEPQNRKQNLMCKKCGRTVEVEHEAGAEYQCTKCGGKMMKAVREIKEEGYRRRE
jgi:DNA-directed RNA polymerase subunit RPC12/RpoP